MVGRFICKHCPLRTRKMVVESNKSVVPRCLSVQPRIQRSASSQSDRRDSNKPKCPIHCLLFSQLSVCYDSSFYSFFLLPKSLSMITNRTTKTLSSLRFSVLLVACSSRQYNGITAFIVYYLVLMPSDAFFKVLAHISNFYSP